MHGIRPRRRTAAGIVWEPRREQRSGIGSPASLGYYGHGPVGAELARVWQLRADEGPWWCMVRGEVLEQRFRSFTEAAACAAARLETEEVDDAR